MRYNYNNNYSTTNNGFNITYNSQYSEETISRRKRKCISPKCIIISLVSILVVSGIVITIVAVALSKDKKNKKKINDEGNEEPIINVEYNKDEIKFFNIEKNISSKIIEDKDEKIQKDFFNYVCILGVKDETKDEKENKILYEGFFAILSTIYYNTTLKKFKNIRTNLELEQILNKNRYNTSLRSIEEDNESEDESIKPFLKISFYSNGTYKDIFRPKNLLDNNYNEMKELLDIILPKIITKKMFLEQKNDIIKEEKRIGNLLAYKNAKILNKKYNKNHIQILSLSENNESNGYEVKDENTSDIYYIDSEMDCYTNLLDGEEENNTQVDNNLEKIDNNLTKLDTSKNSSVYSEFSEFRGSNKTTKISIIVDESKGFVKEIFAKTFLNISKQDYIKETDKTIYNEENYIKEEDLIKNDLEINITNDTSKKNIQDNTENNTDHIYNMLDANSIISVIDHHIKINSSFFNESLIEEIYSDYLNKFQYETQNVSMTIINKLKGIIPFKDSNKYAIIEGHNLRNLEEYEGKYYYGLKNFSHRKDVFQTNFLGLDISLGLANNYYPNTGQAYNIFKVDIGDYKISQNIKSFITNEPIITENIQQMSFKLLRLMYSEHLNLENKKKIFLN